MSSGPRVARLALGSRPGPKMPSPSLKKDMCADPARMTKACDLEIAMVPVGSNLPQSYCREGRFEDLEVNKSTDPEPLTKPVRSFPKIHTQIWGTL